MSRVLVIGSGGREHALAWKLKQSKSVEEVFCAPGNCGIVDCAITIPDIKVDDFKGLANLVRTFEIDLTVVGPEVPLVNGIVDYWLDKGLIKEGHFIFGPSKKAARLEGSKTYAKRFMQRHGIPTANFRNFSDPCRAISYIKKQEAPIVVKASGLAQGKGAIVCHTLDDAVRAVDQIMVKKVFGDSGNKIVIEEFMPGEEASILALTDGTTILPLVSSQDHKPIYNNEKGPNTGGMGAYAPAPIVTKSVMKKIKEQILIPTIQGMRQEGSPLIGCLYAGLMIDNGQPRVVEYNLRFGDPEAQPVLTLLENDLFLLLNACVNGKLHEHKIMNKQGAACCVVMASGGYPGKYETDKIISGLDEAAKIPNTYVFHAATKIENEIFITNGGRILGVTGTGSNIEEAINTTYSCVSKISWQDEYHRTDIGQKALRNTQ
ncbi:MAG: phosphoribosylamine--glycine ligase [Nanoarchaeota archaeon]